MTRRVTWASKYSAVSLVLVALSFVAIWVYSGYHGIKFNESLSFLTDDGWCAKGVESYVTHCFGDYAVIDDGLASGNLWDPASQMATPYPPLSWVPAIAANYLGQLSGNWTLGRSVFLAVLALSLLTPAIWVARQAWIQRGPAAFLVIGLASSPFLFVLDRGNTIGLVVAPLLGVALSFVNARHKQLLVFIVICSLLKPQMLLLACLFLVYRRFGYLILTVISSVTLTLAGFLLFPGPFTQNVSNWWLVINRYYSFQAVDLPYPYNLGMSRSVLTVFDVSHLGSLTGEQSRSVLISWLTGHNTLIAALMVAILVGALLLRRSNSNLLFPLIAVCAVIVITPGVSYGYYLAVMLVPAALILRDPNRGDGPREADGQAAGILDRNAESQGRGQRLIWILMIVVLCLILAPLVVPAYSFPSLNLALTATPVPVGILQMLWGPLVALLLFVSVLSMFLRGSSLHGGFGGVAGPDPRLVPIQTESDQ